MSSILRPPRGDPATEWRRSDPDIVVYIPKGDEDGDNGHFLVFEAPSGDLLAMWTQSTVEGHGDNNVVIARSKDGTTWSEPQWIAGARGPEKLQASWGFPVVSRQGHIYCFYAKESVRFGIRTMSTTYSVNTSPMSYWLK